ncbi:hypothetical protein CDAR_468521 [Caerostris darwini]|uniref:Uncharacterized protein n=1 Tax=Caerostris darwini TaxID=1538125 RepID=A0AAV4Q1W7_9ARAC|nr:hypothetical protein CDAR_468521 [Caerostris darwini]
MDLSSDSCSRLLAVTSRRACGKRQEHKKINGKTGSHNKCWESYLPPRVERNAHWHIKSMSRTSTMMKRRKLVEEKVPVLSLSLKILCLEIICSAVWGGGRGVFPSHRPFLRTQQSQTLGPNRALLGGPPVRTLALELAPLHLSTPCPGPLEDG